MVGGIWETIQTYAYNIIMGVVILLVGFGLGIIIKKISLKILKELELNKIMSKVNVTYNLEKWVSNILSYVVYLFTIVLFLDQLGIKSIVLYLAVGAVLMLIILTSLVGLKDVIPNFVGWLLIQKRGNLKEGHTVDIKEISGVIEKIGFLETEIRTPHKDVLYVPNSLFMKSKFRVHK
ncbi:MAG: mechanosensitive ion channel domain-containing protein [Candidatus Woesearchaeota archaeon]